MIDRSQLVGEALRANFCELLRLFQLKRTRGLTVRLLHGADFRRLLSTGLSLTGSFQWGRTKWQV
jgi:hypothetical protein